MQVIQTPWGPSQHVKEHATGILSISTAGHGGIMLSPERWALVSSVFPDFKPWAGEGWLEEDTDYAIAIVLWPALFKAHTVWQIVEQGLRAQPNEWSNTMMCIRSWLLHKPAGRALARKAREWAELNGDKWLAGSMSSGRSGGWSVEWLRVGSNERRVVVMPDYPDSIMSTEELDALAVPA